jgi:hypothetical protein
MGITRNDALDDNKFQWILENIGEFAIDVELEDGVQRVGPNN